MKLPDPVKATIQAFVTRFGLPSPATEDEARAWTQRVAEQVRFSHGPTWGHKKAAPDRPHSADVIARQEVDRLLGWDLLFSAGSPQQAFIVDPESMDITGQTFESVEAVDYLGGTAPPPEPGGGDSECCTVLLATLQDMQHRLALLEQAVAVGALASRQEELCDLTAQRIQASTDAILAKLATMTFRCKLPWG